MAINDPRAIRYCNEVLRPLAERVRSLLEDVERAEQAWRDEIGVLIPNDANEAVLDGRENEGVSRLSGQEVNAVRAVFTQLRTLRLGSATTALANVDTRIGKVCVRTLRD